MKHNMNGSSSEDESSSDEDLKEVAMNLGEKISKNILQTRQDQSVGDSSLFVLDRKPQTAVQSPGDKQKADHSKPQKDHKKTKKKKN
jgi:hypothetical protein